VRECVESCVYLCRVMVELGIDIARFLRAGLRSRAALTAENLFLRKQLALYRERQVKPRRASDPVVRKNLAQQFKWSSSVSVQPYLCSDSA
jgi:putative transposase